MNRLPAVLQKEIWEYVHGDRAFWKTQYELVLDSLESAFDFRHSRQIHFPKSPGAAWSRCVTDNQKSFDAWPGFGKLIRAFRRYLSSINVPMFPDSREEWDIHNEVWGKWKQSNTT